MTVLYTINAVLIGAVSLVALTIMLYWNHATGGRFRPANGRWTPVGGWTAHPSGRSLMGLLGIVFFITLNAAVQIVISPLFPIMTRAIFYFALYLVFIYTLAKIGFTIRNEIRGGRRHHSNLPETGNIDITAKEDANG